MNTPFTIVIAGPIKSRFTESLSSKELIKAIEIIKTLNNKNQIILSTYENEVPNSILSLVDNVIINHDFGPDLSSTKFGQTDSRANVRKRNTTRMLITASNGISHAKNLITIKTRIELIPENYELFSKWYLDTLKIINTNENDKLGFFIQHQTGFKFSVNGLLAVLPDTFQISKTENLLILWKESLKFWTVNKNYLCRPEKKHPITNEQVLGLTYFKIKYNFKIIENLSKFDRHYFSFKLLKNIITAESNDFIFFDHNLTGITKNKFIGTSFLRFPKNINSTTRITFLFRFIVLIGKRLKHRRRRKT